MTHLDRNHFRGNPRRPATMAEVRSLVTMLEHALDKIRDDAQAAIADMIRIEVVAALNDLPANAPPTRWYRVTADPSAVYIGNGPTRPLSRFTTTPV